MATGKPSLELVYADECVDCDPDERTVGVVGVGSEYGFAASQSEVSLPDAYVRMRDTTRAVTLVDAHSTDYGDRNDLEGTISADRLRGREV